MREITGRKVLMFTVGAFGIIIAVNLVMAYKAISTFPGLEVKSSYVAGVGFDARKQAQQALGWTARARYMDGTLSLTLTDSAGLPAPVSALSVLIGRSTVARDDRMPEFVELGGQHVAATVLAPGKWTLRIEATAADGTPFQQRLDLQVKG